MSSKHELPPEPEPLPAMAVDAHTHLDALGASTPDAVRAAVDRAQRAGVHRVVTVADDISSAQWTVHAAERDHRVVSAVALHPTRTETFTADDRNVLVELAEHPRVVAVGETGLDYYWDYASPEAQQEAFRWHIDLAKRVGKPLMIHDREAHEDILRILHSEGAPETVVFHCFSGDAEFARRCLDEGYVLSFAGTATFRNAKGVRAAAEIAPSEQMLVETDAPFLTPHPYRGRPNEPFCVNYTLRELAHLRDEPLDELTVATRRTAERTFSLDPV